MAHQGGGDNPAQLTVRSQGHMSPDTEENVITQTEDVFYSFAAESYKIESDREEFHDRIRTPSMPQLTQRMADPFSPASQVGRRLAMMGDDLYKKHQGEFDDMIDTLQIDRLTAYDKFKGVARKLMEGPMNWGRVVALFTFGYKILAKIIGLGELIKDFAQMVSSIVSNIVTFIKDTALGIARWIARQGGWRSAENYEVPSLSWWGIAGISGAAVFTLGLVWYLHGGFTSSK